MKRLIVLAATAALLGVSCARHRPLPVSPPQPPPRPQPVTSPKPQPVSEVRAVWVSDTAKLDWNRATAQLQRAGYNTMYVNLASGGAAFYPSSVLPKVNAQSLSDGINIAHRRGIAVHGKFIVTFMFKTTPTFQNKLRTAGRIMRGADGKPINQAGYYWLCPSNSDNRSLVLSALAEMLRYPVDGVQFDYIRFNENPSCFCPHCREAFEKSVGAKLKKWPADALTGVYASRFSQWRVAVINQWMADLSHTVRSVRPNAVISAAIFPDLKRAREEKGQDWKTWVERDYVDYICPMNYTTDPGQFEQRARETQTTLGRRDRVVVGIGSWKFKDMRPLAEQIKICRRLEARGFALFSWDDAEARDFLPKFAIGR